VRERDTLFYREKHHEYMVQLEMERSRFEEQERVRARAREHKHYCMCRGIVDQVNDQNPKPKP
jgi:hypothetical protein